MLLDPLYNYNSGKEKKKKGKEVKVGRKKGGR